MLDAARIYSTCAIRASGSHAASSGNETPFAPFGNVSVSAAETSRRPRRYGHDRAAHVPPRANASRSDSPPGRTHPLLHNALSRTGRCPPPSSGRPPGNLAHAVRLPSRPARDNRWLSPGKSRCWRNVISIGLVTADRCSGAARAIHGRSAVAIHGHGCPSAPISRHRSNINIATSFVREDERAQARVQ